MRSLVFFFLMFQFSSPIQAEEENVTYGPVYIAQYRMDLDLSDFKVEIKSSIDIKASLHEGSLQWIRSFNNILMPRAILKLKVNETGTPIYLKYNGKSIALSTHKTLRSSEFYVSLLSSEKVSILRGDKEIGTIQLVATASEKNKKRELIDYTCSRNNIKIKGLENEYVSVGCHQSRIGQLHWGKAQVQVAVYSTNVKLINGQRPPFFIELTKSSSTDLNIIDQNGKHKKITISATVPKKLPKLVTAWGSGPYMLSASDTNDKNKSVIAPTLFLYGKYDLMGGASLKFFNATVYNKAFFNNFGLYFSYLLVDAMDKRLLIQPLLGAQTLKFQLTGDHRTINKVIFPQGFEFLLKHGLGIKNNTMALGLFMFPSEEESYSNMWFRFGRGMFWELNYISYKGEGARVATWGLSFGLPLKGFL